MLNGLRCIAIWTAAFGNLKMANLFLFANVVDVTAKDRNGNTALGSAIYKGHLEAASGVVKVLLDAGADVNAKLLNGLRCMWRLNLDRQK